MLIYILAVLTGRAPEDRARCLIKVYSLSHSSDDSLARVVNVVLVFLVAGVRLCMCPKHCLNLASPSDSELFRSIA